MTRLLVCKCGDCTHWEIINADVTRDDLAVAIRDVGVIKCKTCAREYPAVVRVTDHELLTEVEHEA